MPIRAAAKNRFESRANRIFGEIPRKKSGLLSKKECVFSDLREGLASPYRRASLLRHGKRAD
jgi:hypothetical protein